MFKKIDPKDPIDCSFYAMGSKCLQNTIQRIYDSQLVTTDMTVSVLKKREDIQSAL